MTVRSVHDRVSARVTELVGQGRPFVRATVVRAQCPTSARPGDAAVVLADGSIEGFVGGQCAESSVKVAALGTLERQEPMLLRILPGEDDGFPETDGAETVVNPCLSGGALEIFLEPHLPAPRLVLAGVTPIVDALAELAPGLGFEVVRGTADEVDPAGGLAVIVASHGRDEESALRRALDAGVPFVGLVASRKRADAVLGALELSCCERERVHSPVGQFIGARTAEEIALSILVDVVKARRLDGLRALSFERVDAPATAIDPVCGMTVAVGPDTPHLRHDDIDFWYCNPGCRSRHAEEVGAT